jgi:heme/copper-type cytochrome/quinol oxidase subunit 2
MDTQLDYLGALVLGLCVWSALAWTLSLLGIGSLHELRWFSLLLALGAFALRPRPWIVFAYTRFAVLGATQRSIVGALLGWWLVLFARTTVATGYDALWYGLRGDRVLVAGGSAFDSLDLVSPVYYFPKLYELFLVPLSALGDTSVIAGVTLCVFVFLLVTCNEWLRELGVRSTTARLGCVATCATLPAVANIAIMAKPDLLAALLVLLGGLHGLRYLAERSAAAAVWMLACLILATQAKLTAVPYAGMLVLCVIACRLRERAQAVASPASAAPVREAGLVLVLSVIVAALVTWRTFALTGMPTIGPDPLFRVWQWLGFELRAPAGTLDWTSPQDWTDVPALIADILFHPQVLKHMVISWIGNVWLWLGAIAAAGLLVRTRVPIHAAARSARVLASVLALTGVALLLGWRYGVRGSDGNYFIAAVVPAILVLFAAAWRAVAGQRVLQVTLLSCLAAFCAMQASYAFVSAGWAPGTRAFDLDFADSPRDRKQQDRHAFQASGLARIAEHLRAVPGLPHVVGYVSGTAGFHLAATWEGLWSVGYSRPEYMQSEQAFLDYLREFDIHHVVLPNQFPDPDPTGVTSKAVFEAMEGLRREGRARVLVDREYTLYEWDAGF